MVAVLFSGQGSQRPGMGRELHASFEAAREVFDRVSQAIGIDIAEMCFESSEETLRSTENAQVALYTCGLAGYRALVSRLGEGKIRALAGHSVGEYAAVAACGSLSIEDGAKLVRKRGELMAQSGSARPGTMAAVMGLDAEVLAELLSQIACGTVVIANDNCPGQLVISGDVDAVQAASAVASEKGAKRVLPLNVSGAFHSPLMEEPARQMGVALAGAAFGPAIGPRVYSNVTAETVEDHTAWPELLERQLKSPVLWQRSIEHMVRDGVHAFVECGSGEVLIGLLKRIDKTAIGLRAVDAITLETTVSELGDAA